EPVKRRLHVREVIDWTEYEARWADVHQSTRPLSFADIPWPQARQPLHAAHITAPEVLSFLTNDPNKTHRRKRALLVWHPDRFERLMGRVLEKDRPKVQEAVGVVARILTA
ncbi:hypothetical protein CYLTODRAFT_332396, partial [Cylindrobasidium torrendii FP15055 ss-10]